MLTVILLFLLAAALSVIGVLLQLGEELGGAFLGAVSAVTKKMGPGIVYEPPKSSRAHWFFYVGALASLVGAIWEIFQ